MFLSAVSVLVVAQSSSEIPEGLMNNPVYSMPGFIVWPKTTTYSRALLYSHDLIDASDKGGT